MIYSKKIQKFGRYNDTTNIGLNRLTTTKSDEIMEVEKKKFELEKKDNEII